MALSGNLFSTLNGTFRKQRCKMDVSVWENVFISTKMEEDGVDPPQQQAIVDVLKKHGLILIEYVYVRGTGEKKRYIRFGNIERIGYPTISSVMLDLDDGAKMTFTFGTQSARDDFIEAITVVSSDSGNEGS